MMVIEDHQSLFGRGHAVRESSQSWRFVALMASEELRSWRQEEALGAGGQRGLDSQRRSIKDWPDWPGRIVVLARMTVADSWSKLANLALTMEPE